MANVLLPLTQIMSEVLQRNISAKCEALRHIQDSLHIVPRDCYPEYLKRQISINI